MAWIISSLSCTTVEPADVARFFQAAAMYAGTAAHQGTQCGRRAQRQAAHQQVDRGAHRGAGRRAGHAGLRRVHRLLDDELLLHAVLQRAGRGLVDAVQHAQPREQFAGGHVQPLHHLVHRGLPRLRLGLALGGQQALDGQRRARHLLHLPRRVQQMVGHRGHGTAEAGQVALLPGGGDPLEAGARTLRQASADRVEQHPFLDPATRERVERKDRGGPRLPARLALRIAPPAPERPWRRRRDD